MKRFKIVLMLLVLSSFGFGQTSISIGHDITDIGIKKTFNERIYATSNVGIALYRVGHAVEPIFYGSYYSFVLE